MATYFNWPGGMFGGQSNSKLQSSGMLTKEQLLQLFRDFSNVLDLLETKNRITDAVMEKQEAVNVTTEIQEELFLKMGVNTVYADDRDLMIHFYHVSREQMACEEAELGPEDFARKMEEVKKFQQQQIGMLRQLRGIPLDEQQAFFQELQSKVHEAQSEGGAAMIPQEIQEFFEQHGALQPKAGQSPQPGLHQQHY